MLFNNPLKKIKKIANKVDALDEKISKLSNEELKEKTIEFKERLNKETLDDILPEAYAVIREAANRVLGKKPYFVQIMGGIALHNGEIAQLRTGEGKEIATYCTIPTPKGWMKAGKIHIGDIVFDKYGTPTTITGVFPQGIKTIYILKLRDGREIHCGENHLWFVYDGYLDKKGKAITTKQMIDGGVLLKRGYHYHLPTSKCVQYPEKNLKIDPYVMGMFLGDGCKNQNHNFELSTADVECVELISHLLKANNYKKNSEYNHSWTFHTGNKLANGKNETIKIKDFAPEYEDLLSSIYCHEKYIPMEYKIASEEQRWALIQGLMDSDGNIYKDKEGKRYNLQFSTTSPQLRDDFMEVVYSLGWSCSWKYGKRAENKAAKHDQYVVRINVPHNIKPNFFRLHRKKDIAIEASKLPDRRKNYDRIAIVDIQKLEEKTEQVCFTVDNPEHLFLVGNYVVTHNTLTETMPAYLNALTGKGVHIVTVNDYLAKRDMEEMGKVFKFLGLSVSFIYPKMDPELKQKAYKCDIVYGTNKEFGFDYLRDNMAKNIKETYQRELNFAIIDEADSILIDEARTPLIISGQGQESTDIYKKADACVKSLIRGEDAKDLTKIESIMDNMENRELTQEELDKKGDYTVNEKDGTVILTDRGIKKVEAYFEIDNLGDIEHITLSHHINQALKANNLMLRDKNYIVKNGKVELVDDFTGRVLDGRRYSDGLHQAIEAKEGVEIQAENTTYATISLQNYFRLYEKIAGMTGTAATEKTEFKDIYHMNVVEIPTNLPVIRDDLKDKIYLNSNAKFNAIIEDIKQKQQKGQPVLIGTPTIEQSEKLSKALKAKGIKHNILNAKNNEKEAEIISEAGKLGVITISTNMAGRGTDILLGGNPEFNAKKRLAKELDSELFEIATSMLPATNEKEKEVKERYLALLNEEKEICEEEAKKVKEVGGLHVIGTAKHEARRIDNQLRGRAGRQGDVGSSQFFISLEDDIVRLFGGERIKLMIEKLGIPEDTEIENAQISKTVETAQKRYELKNFDIRKNTLEYDDVNNGQRQTIYSLRRDVLEGKDMNDVINDMFKTVSKDIVYRFITSKKVKDNDIVQLNEYLKQFLRIEENCITKNSNRLDILNQVEEIFNQRYLSKVAAINERNEDIRNLQRFVLLKIIDKEWISYITALQNLRDSVSLVAYGTEKPIDAYKKEAAIMFSELINAIRHDTIKALLNISIKRPEPVKIVLKPVVINLDNIPEKPDVEKAGSGLVLKTKDTISPKN